MASGLGLRLRPPAGAVLHVAAEEAQVSVQSPPPHPTQRPQGGTQPCWGANPWVAVTGEALWVSVCMESSEPP